MSSYSGVEWIISKFISLPQMAKMCQDLSWTDTRLANWLTSWNSVWKHRLWRIQPLNRGTAIATIHSSYFLPQCMQPFQSDRSSSTACASAICVYHHLAALDLFYTTDPKQACNFKNHLSCPFCQSDHKMWVMCKVQCSDHHWISAEGGAVLSSR